MSIPCQPLPSLTRLNVPIKRLRETSILPTLGSAYAAGVDLFAAIDAPVTLHPGESVLVPCGFALAVPDGFAAILVPRSGLGAKHGIVLGNLMGVIDADYRGEVMVSLWNRSRPGTDPFIVAPLDRIAQMLLMPVERAHWMETDTLPETARGSGGFGSTGQ